MVGRRRLFTDQQLIALHKKGMIDREVADELGIHKTTVRKRRMKLGLKANGHNRLFTDEQLIELYEQGFIDREIGEKIRAILRTVRKRRRLLGLKGHSRRLFSDQQLIDLHEKGMSDREIAEELGSISETVGVHRRRLGLKPVRAKAVIHPARRPIRDDTPHRWYVGVSWALRRRFSALVKFIARVVTA